MLAVLRKMQLQLVGMFGLLGELVQGPLHLFPSCQPKQHNILIYTINLCHSSKCRTVKVTK